MPRDIALCRNKECPERETCYRFMTKSSDWKTFGAFTVKPGETKCSYFWPLDEPNDENQPLQKKKKKRGRPKLLVQKDKTE